MPVIISDIQSAFFQGHQMMDSILAAYECIHYLRLKRGGKKGFMSLNLDMSKTYDSIE